MQFKIRDKVYLKLSKSTQLGYNIRNDTASKPSSECLDLFIIEEVIEALAYKLRLLPKLKIHYII